MMMSWWIFLCRLCVVISFLAPQHGQSAPGGKPRNRSSRYVHEWVPCPDVYGYDLQGRNVPQKVPPGDMHVIIFYASWCVACQNQIERMRDLERLMKPRVVTFSWLFAHDLQEDVRGFAKGHRLPNPVIATKDTVAGFHNPGLPAVYVCDRNGWLLNRFLKMEDSDLVDLKKFLMTASGY